ncbi:hypothetical protein BASA81_010028 [Batrachochytrium salamandrivorans]|nr:hypothetical protein BASA81_010028 [Batrachochytrium salamandrivorans]
MEKAFDLFNSGDYEGALKLFEDALKSSPKEDWPAIHSNIGAVLLALEDFPSAVAAFDDALGIDPNNIDSLVNRGLALIRLEQFDRALVSFQSAIELSNASHHSALCGKSQALVGLRRFDEAVDSADLACKLDSNHPLGFQDKAFALLKSRRFHAANQTYELALKRTLEAGEDDDDTKRLFSIALVQEGLELEVEGERDQALVLFHRANELRPDSQALLNEGLILLTKKRHDDGVRCLQQSIALEPDYFEPHNALGTFYATLDKFPEAKQYLERACGIEPREIEPLFNLGFVRLKGFRDVDGARRDWLHVLEICPGEPHATEALRLLDEALRLAKERGSDGKKELDDAIKAIEGFTSCAPLGTERPTAKLVMDDEGQVMGLSPGNETDQLIAKLDRLDKPDNNSPASLETDCNELAKQSEGAADQANQAASALKKQPDNPELAEAAMNAAFKAANVAAATSPVAFAAADKFPGAALDAAIAATKGASAAIDAAEQAVLADPLNADAGLQAVNAALDALKNAQRAIDKAAAADPAKAKQATDAVNKAIQRGNQVKKSIAAVKQSPSYQDARNALRKNAENSLDRLTRGNNGIKAVPYGQDLLKKTGRMEALLAGHAPPVLVTDNEGKLVGMTKSEGEAVLATLDALPKSTPAERAKIAQSLPKQLETIAKDVAQATKDAASKPAQAERAALLSTKAANLAALGVEQAKGLIDTHPKDALDVLEAAVDAALAATAAAEQIIKCDPLKSDYALGIAASALASANAASELCKKIIQDNKDPLAVARAQRILANASRAIAQANNAAKEANTMKGSAAYLDALSKLRKVSQRQPAYQQSEPKAVPFGQSQLRRTGRKLSGINSSGGGQRSGGGGIEGMLASSVSRDRGAFNSKHGAQAGAVGTTFNNAVADSKPKFKTPAEAGLFPFAELKSPKCPPGVDPANKEEYLSPDEFKKLFGKTQAEFKLFPNWKRSREKQQKGIF